MGHSSLFFQHLEEGVRVLRLNHTATMHSIIVEGLPIPLAIIYQADDSNPVAFNYGAAGFLSTDLMKFFFRESNEKSSHQQRNNDGSYCDGSYCDIKTEGTESVIECYFPCVAAK